MRFRCFVVIGAVAAVVAVSLLPVFLQAQAPKGTAGATTWTQKTPWGTPDLQGIWRNDAVTPFERAAQFGTREFLTDQERAALDTDLLARAANNQYRDARKERGTEQDVAGAYNAIWQDDRPQKAGRRTSQVIDPPDGRLPPLTPEAKKRLAIQRDYLNLLLRGSSGSLQPGPPASAEQRAQRPPVYNLDRMNRADGPEDNSAGVRCFGSNLPQIGTRQRIVQSPDAVGIFYDIGQGGGFSRIIPITNAPHSTVRERYGDARARWEGDTLVVDVVNFTQKTEFRGSRENLHLVERYRRLDRNTLEYKVTVEDPTTWTKPWTAVVDMTAQDERANQIYQQTCHEGNYGMIGILANTRAAEKAFREGKGPDPATMDIATGGGDASEGGTALPEGVGRTPLPEYFK